MPLLVTFALFSPFQRYGTYSLKLFIKNCGQTAADGDMVIIDNL